MIVAALAAASVITMIVAMIVGSVRSSRGDLDWSHTKDDEFLPWNAEHDDTA
ncbi:MAG TPA: hypothetical protein VI076_10200 [Actinopolymorphaceae bacterium]